MRGRFLSVPEYLVFNRDHAERFTRKGYTPQEELAWYRPGDGWRVCRTWTLYSKGLQLIYGGWRGSRGSGATDICCGRWATGGG